MKQHHSYDGMTLAKEFQLLLMALSIPTPRHRGLTRPYRLPLEAGGRCANMLGAALAPVAAALLACEGCRNACTMHAAVSCCFALRRSAPGPPPRAHALVVQLRLLNSLKVISLQLSRIQCTEIRNVMRMRTTSVTCIMKRRCNVKATG